MLLHSVRDSLIILAADNDLLITHNPVYKTKVYISGLHIYLLIYFYVYVSQYFCMCTCTHVYGCLLKSGAGLRYTGAGGIGGCELSDRVVGN